MACVTSSSFLDFGDLLTAIHIFDFVFLYNLTFNVIQFHKCSINIISCGGYTVCSTSGAAVSPFSKPVGNYSNFQPDPLTTQLVGDFFISKEDLTFNTEYTVACPNTGLNTEYTVNTPSLTGLNTNYN